MNDRKRKVMLTAKKLFIEKGFASTSVQDILEDAKISKGTFYNYFTSKNECLMAILEDANNESIIRRRELLVGRDKRDKDILAEQIIVRMQVNRELNLLPIYEAVFYSNDEELRNFVKTYHINELKWFAARLIDVYGEEAEPHSFDCSVMTFGMIQQLRHFWTAGTSKELDIEKLVQFTLRRMDALMADLMEQKEVLLEKQMIAPLGISHEELKGKIQVELIALKKKLEPDENSHVYTDFLLTELQAENPRVALLEAVGRSFREASNGTRFSDRVNEALYLLWKYVDIIKTSS
ncbi:TetR/AcrR family transcriptional regulator [Sporosarcina highlanderae]|uniref:TetR/AcrR family transcriptional regulator n=1 Tax=Sporosarcina highlanderae TaxID=3035916 RepID=A0ABT8JNW7_9BACL|nr:TetR/AcrR family transcriptional regulator [Sporosarcina highlanderae]MDN4606107.1 TetR/AcrR family transcriptional regulator [Sporosarcina highlanderae]